jgi:hypothetical protein
MINSFKDSISELENQVNILLDALDNIRDANFKDIVVKAIDSVRKNSFDIENFIKDRIKQFIENDILTQDWATNTSDQLEFVIEKRVPYLTQLFEEQQKALKN